MERSKSMLLLMILTLIILLSSCNGQPNSHQPQVKLKEIDAVLKSWEEIAQINEKFLEGDAWLAFSSIASRASDARKFYTNMQAWYFLEHGNVINGLTLITDAELDEELQRFVINADGVRADLSELRTNGLDAAEYAHPTKIKIPLKDISLTRQDLNLVTDRRDNIRSLKIEELEDSITGSVILITVEFVMTSDIERANTVPQSLIGEVHKYKYEKATGSCIEREEYYLMKGGRQTGSSIIKFTVDKHEILPPQVEEELEQALDELDFYIQVFSDPER